MKKLFSTTLWSILTGVFAVLLVAAIVGSSIAVKYSAAINMLFGTSNYATINDPNAEATEFFSTDYEFGRNGTSLYEEDTKMIEEAEAAGAVLLWNKSGALPLSGSEKVSLLGNASVNIVETGTGSGYSQTFDFTNDKELTTTMKDAFESRGFKVNETLWNFYNSSSHTRTNPTSLCIPWQGWIVDEVPWDLYTKAVTDSFVNFGDAAIITFARSGGEYSDLHYNYSSAADTDGGNKTGKVKYWESYSKTIEYDAENTPENGGYLGLTDEEEDILYEVAALKKNGTFKKVIVLLNTGNTLQMQDFEEYVDDIDACMWIGQTGSTGINAVADLLKGKDMQGNDLIPSGRLTDTWAYDLNSAPATVNDGNYTYENQELFTSASAVDRNFFVKYMVYQEGIYIGYRYYETRYADVVTEQGNANSSVGSKHSQGSWMYNGEVAFPFGYGLSYTKFDYSDFSVEKEGDVYHVNVTVKNSGNYSGKEVVQVYLQKPYTEYDKQMKIEKSAIELAGYAKTGVLAPQESATVTVDVPEDYFKTYDVNGEQTYIIEESDEYFLTVASDAHVALNNILEARGYQSKIVAQEVLGGAANTKSVNFGKNFVEQISLEEDYYKYSESAQTGYEITNRLNSGDINKYVNRGENSVVYLSRNNWGETYPTQAAKLKLNQAMANDLRHDNVPDDLEYDFPVYGKFESGSTDGIPDVSNGDLVAYMFMEAPLYPEKERDRTEVYDDGLVYSAHWERMWNQLLDQMTFEEQAEMVFNSYHQINGAVSIALPGSKQENGPVGVTKRQEGGFALPEEGLARKDGWVFVAYPCAGIIASSYDNDIAERVGEHKSEDMLYLGYNGIYGPGVNMHRSPFGGRAFEYPSEDPLLAGTIEAYESAGIESKGCLAYAKHFALNDMETNRVNCGIWSNEQASREIYLRPFEIVFTKGKASATMNSFTRIGTRWNGGCYDLMTTILQDEWGYDGIVITDWVTKGSAMSYIDGVMAGTNTFDGNGEDITPAMFALYKGNAAISQAIREAAKHVIYNVVRTNAMNGMSINSRTVRITPWWQGALIGLQIGLGVILAGCAGMLIASIVLRIKAKKAAVSNTDEQSDPSDTLNPQGETSRDGMNTDGSAES